MIFKKKTKKNKKKQKNNNNNNKKHWLSDLADMTSYKAR